LQWQMFHKISQIIKAYDKQAQTGWYEKRKSHKIHDLYVPVWFMWYSWSLKNFLL
jgi:hypothetical protein